MQLNRAPRTAEITTTTTLMTTSIKAARQRLSIKENLGYFQIPGSDGPLSWGFLSPFLLEEDCLVQYKARILKRYTKYSNTYIGEIAISLKRFRMAIMVVA